MKDNTAMTCVGLVVSIALLTVLGMFMNGWALSTIWNWFIPPVFHLVPLTLWQAVGVSMVFELFTGTNKISKSQSDNKNTSATEALLTGVVTAILVPVFSVFFAWIVWSIAF